MDKFQIFRELLDVVAVRADVTHADMSNWRGAIEIKGEDDVHQITIEVIIKKKEVESDAEELE